MQYHEKYLNEKVKQYNFFSLVQGKHVYITEPLSENVVYSVLFLSEVYSQVCVCMMLLCF